LGLSEKLFKSFDVFCELYNQINITKINSVAFVSKRTISTERPPLVGEVNANFSG
jgi:hypothetical protein